MHNNFSSLPPALMLLHLLLHFLYDFDLNLDATYCCTSELNVDRKTLLFVYILQGKIGKPGKNQKENLTTRVTKIPKTKRQKYVMNETLNQENNLKKMYTHLYKEM